VTIEIVEIVQIRIVIVTVMTIEIVEIVRIRIVIVTVMTIGVVEIIRIRIVTGWVMMIGIMRGTAMTIATMTIRIVTTNDNSAWADNGPQRGLLEMSPVPSDRCGEIRPPSTHVAADAELCDWRRIHESTVNEGIACCH
jgi:hypothetical protein